MDIERGCLEILFRKISHSCFLNNINTVSLRKENNYKNIPKREFILYSSEVFPQYTQDEVENIYNYLQEKASGNGGIFNFVSEISKKFLIEYENEPICKFDQILRWRDISFKLGQDLFTTAYFAKEDSDSNKNRVHFTWSPITKTDNNKLHDILRKGIAENHFHLNGSTQIFSLNWVCLMNNISERQKDFAKIKNYMDAKQTIETIEVKKRSLYNECIIAAFIRLYLFSYIKNDSFDVFKDFKSGSKKLNELDAMWVSKLQRMINVQKNSYGYRKSNHVLDYAIDTNYIDSNFADNCILAGERKFMYDCFYNIFQGKFTDYEINCFYVYLLIKNLLRSELIQVNGKLGFKNFSLYQDRKEVFIEGFKQYQHELVRLAINSTMKCQKIVSLEARICPKKTCEKNKEAIKYYDLHSREDNEKEYKHFYVLHFPKSPDNSRFASGVPRYDNVRSMVKQCTKSIVQLLESNEKYKYRIRGIDACSHEIGCRPEVFAQSFRYLTNFTICDNPFTLEDRKPIKLKATYHVGEDFLNLVDGLRAIDEAILFCNLEKGSRLGHALALGIDPISYYELKNYKVIMRKQDIIDDIAWMIGKSNEYGIIIDEILLASLEDKFNDLFEEIYIDSEEILSMKISPIDYYNAWKLRGDNPNLYNKNYYELQNYLNLTSMTEKPLLKSQYYELNKKIYDNIRLDNKHRSLYYYYHFNKSIRDNGYKQHIFNIKNDYVILVKELQEKMRYDIANKGISIETNPSSNYLIGTIKKYDQHPIITFNSNGLKTDVIKEALSVSINTDDQGVFDTFLENEYALIAYALEKSVDENGKNTYERNRIYKWIDNIRQFGLEQVF